MVCRQLTAALLLLETMENGVVLQPLGQLVTTSIVHRCYCAQPSPTLPFSFIFSLFSPVSLPASVCGWLLWAVCCVLGLLHLVSVFCRMLLPFSLDQRLVSVSRVIVCLNRNQPRLLVFYQSPILALSTPKCTVVDSLRLKAMLLEWHLCLALTERNPQSEDACPTAHVPFKILHCLPFTINVDILTLPLTRSSGFPLTLLTT